MIPQDRRPLLIVLLIFSILLILYGVAMLSMAELSAEKGGGLLGGFGFFPLGLGLLLLLVSAGVWLMQRKR